MYISSRNFLLDNISAQVWRMDKDKTWSEISNGLPIDHYPSYVYSLTSSPNEVWVVFSNFVQGQKVFYSKDSGANWQNISFNLPNIPVNCVAVQDDRTKNMYVGTDNGVYRLDTFSKTWILFSDGLPNVIVSELEIHPKTSSLFAATFRAGVWQTQLYSTDSNISVSKIHYPEENLVLYPNPVTDLLTLKFNNCAGMKHKVLITDVCGKIVCQKALQSKDDVHEDKISFNEFMPGVYYIIVESGNFRSVKRITHY